MSRKAVSLVTLICLVGLLVPNLSASAANPTPDGPPQVVRVPATAMAQVEALELAPYLSLDYGSYHWLELGSADYARLAASQVPFVSIPEAGQLQVQGYRFDPLWNGEPALSAGMRAEGSGPGLRLIQLTGPAQDRWLVQLEAAGLKPLQYYPHNTYLVWATAAEAEAATALDFVRWQGAFHPGYKIDRELDRRTGPIHNVDVMFYNDGLIDATLDALTALGATVLNSYPSQPDKAFYDAVVQIDAAALADVARLNTVLWLGYLSPEPILDDEMSSQIVAGNYVGGVPQIGYFPWLTGLGYDGSGVRWAIVDTGVDWDHPDLGPHIAGGYDFPGACSYPGEPGSDCTGGGHGTHVAGIVGGDATAGYTDSQGFYYGLGIAPGYEIFAMNSLSASAWPPAGGWQEHSKRAVLGGAIGGNNSWTTGEGTDHGYQASERTHDFMVRDGNFDTPSVAEPFIEVFSAGNSGSSGLTAPKEAKNLIVVASSRNYRVGNIDTLSSFSSWGPAVDGRWVPTVAAPGEQIASTRNDLGGSCSTPIPGTNNMYAYCSGTSMAAPHVSGSITLLTEWWRTFNAGADPSPAMAKALLVSGAVDMNEGHAIPNIYEGWGRVHLTNVMDNDTLMYYQDQQHTFDNTGESWTITLGVPDPSKPLKVSVAWSDAPGMVGANPALVNNLDLTVENGGNTYLGNHFSGGWSTPGGSADAINNLENVFVQAPGGLATITIQATNLPGDGVPISGDTTDQDFALVCYNCAQMTIELVKTVGTNPNACATTDEIAVPPGSEVTYCYEVTNTGIEDLATHDLTDSELGDLLIGFPYTLAPGASTFLTQTATITQTTLNVATWTAYDAAGASVSDSDSALVTIQPPAIELTKTVGTDPATCATTDAIEVAPGTDVYYCYEVQNTGAYTLPLHDLVDSELGVIFSGLAYDLGPGASIDTVAAGLTLSATITGTTVNTATWTAYLDGGPSAEATDTATVGILPPAIELTKTVGTEPGICATTDQITVLEGTDVYYCYEVQNTGAYTLPLHDLVDSELGVIFSGLVYDLGPGASIDTVAAGLILSATITQTTVNTATWTAYLDGGPSAEATDTATVVALPPFLDLAKTVGTDPAMCATTDLITVTEGTDVYYCYEVTNTGAYTLPLHDLVDSELGVIFSSLAYDLGPGASIDTVAAGLTLSATITQTTVNTATWTVFYPPFGLRASASDTATVIAVERPNYWFYLPLIVRSTGS